MSDATLPQSVVMRKLVIRNGTLDGVVEIAALPRLHQLLVDDLGKVQVYLEFESDDQRRDRIQGRIQASLKVYCQRCLEPMSVELALKIDAAAVTSDEKAQQLPRNIDPVMLSDEDLQVYELVEDELLLALPIVTRHEEPCGEKQYFGGAEKSEETLLESDASAENSISGSNDENKQGVQTETRRPFEGLGNMLKKQ